MIRSVWVFSLLTGLLVLAALALGGCATQGPVVQGDNYCRLAKRISWSKADTPPTVDQIRRHNAKHRRICS